MECFIQPLIFEDEWGKWWMELHEGIGFFLLAPKKSDPRAPKKSEEIAEIYSNPLWIFMDPYGVLN